MRRKPPKERGRGQDPFTSPRPTPGQEAGSGTRNRTADGAPTAQPPGVRHSTPARLEPTRVPSKVLGPPALTGADRLAYKGSCWRVWFSDRSQTTSASLNRPEPIRDPVGGGGGGWDLEQTPPGGEACMFQRFRSLVSSWTLSWEL